MRRNLAIHVGAGKCASSSLQSTLHRISEASEGSLKFVHLNGSKLLDADQLLQSNRSIIVDYIDGLLSAQSDSQVIISHEVMGRLPELVCSIATQALERHNFDHVAILGYSRIQSCHHIAAFSQWYFRDRERLLNDSKILTTYDLDWKKYTALERSLLTVSLIGGCRNWFSYYQRLSKGLESLGDAASVVSSHIPTNSLPYSLLGHFLTSTGLSLDVEDLEIFEARENPSFHPVLTYAMSSHLNELSPQQHSFFPGPHEGNEWLFRVCKRLSAADPLISQFDTFFSSRLKHSLLGHIDCRAYPHNKRYCDLMAVDINYFKPSDDASLLSKEELLDLATDTAHSRNQGELEEFNRTIENACMQSMRTEIERS